MEVRVDFELRIILMPRVLHDTLGCHPLLHTEADEIAHLSPLRRTAHAHTRRIVARARGLAPASA
jgi:hypothetical protein